MNDLLLNLIDTLSLPLGERAARRALCNFAHEAGYEFFTYTHLCGCATYAVSSYPKEWQELYAENDYVRIDPIVTKAKHGPPIFFWDAEEAKRLGRRDVIKFFKDAGRFGIRSGLTVSAPVGFKNRMVFTLACGDPTAIVEDEPDIVTISMAVAFIHARLGSAKEEAPMATEVCLSCREAECLRWFSEGMSMPEIAEVLGIGYRSVRSYIDEATKKLGATNGRHAASVAIRLGLI